MPSRAAHSAIAVLLSPHRRYLAREEERPSSSCCFASLDPHPRHCVIRCAFSLSERWGFSLLPKVGVIGAVARDFEAAFVQNKSERASALSLSRLRDREVLCGKPNA